MLANLNQKFKRTFRILIQAIQLHLHKMA